MTTSLSNLRITCDANRKLIAVETDDFRIKLNGKGNGEYASILKALGIQLVFETVLTLPTSGSTIDQAAIALDLT